MTSIFVCMKLCIAEKPSVAKDIAAIIGAKNRQNGYYYGNGYAVTWTFGHLCTLKEPHEYSENWKFWNVNTMPIIPDNYQTKVIPNKGVQTQFNIIKELVDKAEQIINCGDAGIEGELIQRWVLELAGNTKPIKRLWISSLTEEAIKDGFKNLKNGNDYNNLFQAGKSRAVCDWLLGMNATRLFTLKFARDKQVLSIGRVQTPTLALVVNRQLEIDNFVSKIYFEIKTTYKNVVFNYNAENEDENASKSKSSFSNREDAQVILDKIKQSDFEVLDTIIKKGNESAPKLFDLTSLQVESNKKLGLSAEQTLNTIQGLYEKKLVTYPRVDTTYLSEDIYPKIPGILKGLHDYQDLTKALLADKIKKSKKVFDDKKVTDHHAIIPTGEKAYLNGIEKEIYHLITQRFIAAFYPDCKISNTTILGKVDDIPFKATGKQILFPGWREVFNKDKKQDKSNDQNILPSFTKGEKGPHQPDLLEKETNPPKYFTEATLLRAMESAGRHVDDEELREALKDNGIGRPSTRANIIETLFRRLYIKREKKRIIATPIGIALIKTIKDELLKSAELTGQWENKLKKIEKGEYAYDTFVNEMTEWVRKLTLDLQRTPTNKFIGKNLTVNSVKKKNSNKIDSKESKIICPKCNKGEIKKGKTAYGCSDYNNGCKTIFPFVLKDKKLTDTQLKGLITKKKSSKIKGFKFNDLKFEAKLSLDSNFNTIIHLIEDQKCPKCKDGKIKKGKSAFGCSNYTKGCKTIVKFEDIN